MTVHRYTVLLLLATIVCSWSVQSVQILQAKTPMTAPTSTTAKANGGAMTMQAQATTSVTDTGAQTEATTLRLRSGTPVVIRTINEIVANSVVAGSIVDFKVIGDVKVKDQVVIANGTMGHATIATVEKRGPLGDPASVTVSDFYVVARDGSRIPLSATLSQTGQNKQVKSLALGLIVCLPFLLIKGGEAVIPAGTEKTVYTSSESTIDPGQMEP